MLVNNEITPAKEIDIMLVFTFLEIVIFLDSLIFLKLLFCIITLTNIKSPNAIRNILNVNT